MQSDCKRVWRQLQGLRRPCLRGLAALSAMLSNEVIGT